MGLQNNIRIWFKGLFLINYCYQILVLSISTVWLNNFTKNGGYFLEWDCLMNLFNSCLWLRFAFHVKSRIINKMFDFKFGCMVIASEHLILTNSETQQYVLYQCCTTLEFERKHRVLIGKSRRPKTVVFEQFLGISIQCNHLPPQQTTWLLLKT